MYELRIYGDFDTLQVARNIDFERATSSTMEVYPILLVNSTFLW